MLIMRLSEWLVQNCSPAGNVSPTTAWHCTKCAPDIHDSLINVYEHCGDPNVSINMIIYVLTTVRWMMKHNPYSMSFNFLLPSLSDIFYSGLHLIHWIMIRYHLNHKLHLHVNCNHNHAWGIPISKKIRLLCVLCCVTVCLFLNQCVVLSCMHTSQYLEMADSSTGWESACGQTGQICWLGTEVERLDVVSVSLHLKRTRGVIFSCHIYSTIESPSYILHYCETNLAVFHHWGCSTLNNHVRLMSQSPSSPVFKCPQQK